MTIAAEAWRLREAARGAIAAGEFGRAFELADRAQEAQSTSAGEALVRLGGWLRESAEAESRTADALMWDDAAI